MYKEKEKVQEAESEIDASLGLDSVLGKCRSSKTIELSGKSYFNYCAIGNEAAVIYSEMTINDDDDDSNDEEHKHKPGM